MKQIDAIAAVLVVVGALNGGLVGVAGAYQALFFKGVQSRWAHPSPIHAR